jgi:hypothetical protein
MFLGGFKSGYTCVHHNTSKKYFQKRVEEFTYRWNLRCSMDVLFTDMVLNMTKSGNLSHKNLITKYGRNRNSTLRTADTQNAVLAISCRNRSLRRLVKLNRRGSMKNAETKLVLAISALLLVGTGCISRPAVTTETPAMPTIDNSLTLKQERMMNYRKECQEEWQTKLNTFDEVVKSLQGITPEQAQNLARRAGITDENNLILDSDVWVKGCMDKKEVIFE